LQASLAAQASSIYIFLKVQKCNSSTGRVLELHLPSSVVNVEVLVSQKSRNGV
jgi:hypothetical protein